MKKKINVKSETKTASLNYKVVKNYIKKNLI